MNYIVEVGSVSESNIWAVGEEFFMVELDCN